MIGIVVVGGLVVIGATLIAGALIGGLIGTATGAAVDDDALDVPVSSSCREAQEALEDIDRQIAELREEIDEAHRIATTWTSIAIYLGGLSVFATVVGVMLGMSALVSGPAGAFPGFIAVAALVSAGGFAFATAVALGYAASWNERARRLTEDLNLLGEVRLDVLDTISRTCADGGVPQVVDEPTFDVAPF